MTAGDFDAHLVVELDDHGSRVRARAFTSWTSVERAARTALHDGRRVVVYGLTRELTGQELALEPAADGGTR